MSKKTPTPSTEATDLSHVRNIGIAAHIDAGKTTLTERILFYTGASHKIGEVHDGAAHMDWMEEEKAHGITITSAVTKCPWRDHLIQVVDTPGHVDFTIEVERAMRVLDGAVIVMDAVRGVEPQTETVWRQANRFDIPRIVFANKMDRPGASYSRCMETLSRRLHGHPVPVCVPVADEEGVIDLVEQRYWTFSGDRGVDVEVGPIPDHLMDLFQEHRENLLLTAAEADEELEELVLMEEEIPAERIWGALRKLTLEGRIHPFFGGSALRNWGVQPLLDGVLKILPAPLDRPPTIAHKPGTVPGDEGHEEIVEMDASGPLAALAFKVQLWEGRRHVFVRVYRGRLLAGDKVAIAGKNNVERVARVFDVDSNSKRRVDQIEAGQIALLAGLRDATTGDTLCTPDHEVLLESIDTKEPVIGLAVEPETSKDEAKFLDVLGKVCEEDPTLRFSEDQDTGQRILYGMGELHLQIVFERIEREFNLKIRAGTPRVMSRETIAGSGTGEVELNRQILLPDGKEVVLHARVKATVQPLDRDSGIRVTVEPRILPEGAVLTAEQNDAIKNGAQDSVGGGPIEGAPLQDVAVRIDEVEVFEIGSTPQALRIAVSQAIRNALSDGGGLLLQPLMKVEVTVPDENMGSVLGDLQSRKALISGQESEMGTTTISGECPLVGLLGYATELRSLTRGRGQFIMEFSRFDAAG
ncbi:MAG: elongation factor G [Alphaproteobacteria bacterium]|nr:elongation factor G [Alphaproteobacteria bacterium]